MNRLEQAIELHHQGDLSQAERFYLSHLKSNPRDAEALRLLGMLYWQQNPLIMRLIFLNEPTPWDLRVLVYWGTLGS